MNKMCMKQGSVFLSCISIAGLFVLSCAAEQPVKVEVHLLTEQVLGESSQLDRSKFFNVHSTYNGAALTEDDLEQLKSLNVGFGRAFDAPFSAHQNGTAYPDTETIKKKAPDAIAKAKADPLYAYRTRRRITTNEPRAVFNMEDDPVEMARFAVDVLEYHYEDDFRPEFYSPISIPFVAAGKYGDDHKAVMARMTQFIAEVGATIDRRGLDIKVIGYTSAWPVMHFWDFGHWNGRMKMFMDVAGDHIDAIDFILMDATHYDQADSWRSGSRVEALMDLVETYGAMKWGEPKPFAFSEYGNVAHGWPEGDAYSPARASAELNSYNHFLFSLLGRENRLMIAVPFITTKSPWYYRNPKNKWQPYSADLWRPDPESIVNGSPTRFIETEKMEFYRLWQDVKGRRAFAESSDPDVTVYAFVDGKDAYICMNNFKDETHSVSLKLPGQRTKLEAVEVKRMVIPRQQAVQYTVEQINTLSDTFVMEPHETMVIRMTHSAPLDSKGSVKTKTFYSDTYLQPIAADKPVEFRIKGLDVDEHTTGSLRVSIAREHDRSKKPLLTVNGHSVEFPDNWMGDDQVNRKGGFFGAIPVSLPAGIIQAENTISLRFPDDGGRVSTVVLDVHSRN